MTIIIYCHSTGFSIFRHSFSDFLHAFRFKEISELLAARRNTRDFTQFKTDAKQDGTEKDALSGKEEIIGTPEDWKKLLREDNRFKDDKPYGAISLIKRLWPNAYLLAKHKDVKLQSGQELESANNYIAILAMDGDEMGKWISGESGKTPKLFDQLAPKTREELQKFWHEHGWDPENESMPVTPEYHLQFSEALANFSNGLARKVVESFRGKLIYAGGDDILAILPAETALDCAKELRAKFQEKQDGNRWLPGPNANVSCGIAVGHKTFPLHSLVAEAHLAEHRAKGEYSRNALALSILKRSGEILHWGCNFGSGGLELLEAFQKTQTKEETSEEADTSGKFANALAQLLAPYRLKNCNRKESGQDDAERLPDQWEKIISAEFNHVCQQQSLKKDKKTPEALALTGYREYLKYLGKTMKLADFANLFLAAKFLQRGDGENREE